MSKSNWGRWGADDERGALNHLTPDVIKAAAASITTGRVYSLGIPIQGQGVPLLDYRGVPMRLTLQDGTDDGMYASYGAQEGTGAHEDVLVMASHTTSHMDALIHVYEGHQHYNGVPFGEMRALGGAAKLGIEKVGGFAARAVLLDMVAHMCIRDSIRTGHLDMWWDNHAKGQPEGFAQAGIGADAANWLAERDVTAVGSDNAAVEVIPFDTNDFLIVHKILLVQCGIYMLEHLDLRQAAADRSYEGVIAIAPLKGTGPTG